MSTFQADDEYLETAKQCAMEAAVQTGDVWIVYDLDSIFFSRAMSILLVKGAPECGKEVGRAGIDATGKPFWSTLQ